MKTLHRMGLVLIMGLLFSACKEEKGKGQVEAKSPDVNIEAGKDGFVPSQIQVKKGQKLTLHFKRTSDQTCATEVVFPDLKIEKKLPLNETVSIAMPTEENRTLTFQCGMGMYKSKVVVQ